MERNAFQLEVVSPERPLFSGRATALTAEAHDGEMGILPGHAATLALLGTGVLVVRLVAEGGRETTERFAVRGGFLQVSGSKVTLLVTDAVRDREVDAPKVEAELATAKERLRQPPTDAAFAALLDERRWAESRLRIGRGGAPSGH